MATDIFTSGPRSGPWADPMIRIRQRRGALLVELGVYGMWILQHLGRLDSDKPLVRDVKDALTRWGATKPGDKNRSQRTEFLMNRIDILITGDVDAPRLPAVYDDRKAHRLMHEGLNGPQPDPPSGPPAVPPHDGAGRVAGDGPDPPAVPGPVEPTAGEWFCDPMDEHCWVMLNNGVSGSVYLAEMIGSDDEDMFIHDEAERQANGRIMAAAKDLLKSCEGMLKSLEMAINSDSALPQGSRITVSGYFVTEAARARRAIAKAKGIST